MSERKPRRGDELEVALEELDPRGDARGRSGEFRVAVRGGAPGDRVRVEVLRRRGPRIDARVVERLAPGPWASAPRCAHFGSCGGCSFQETAYEEQLAQLALHLRAALEPLARASGGGELPIGAVVPCEPPWAYRNKMDFSFSSRRWIEPGEPEGADAGFALGLHARGRYDKVVDVVRCEIQFEEANAILADVRQLARERGLAPWCTRARRGLLRHLVLRKGLATGEILVDLVTSEEAPEAIRPLAEALLALHPEITTLVQNLQSRPAAVAAGERELVLHGPGVIHEELAGLRFSISANSFFQTNTRQAERLVEIVREEARTARGGTVWDLCCGAGTFAIALARGAARVIGVEREPAAVADAERNARLNGVANARFLELEVERIADAGARDALGLPPPDLCVVDPPRAGLHPRAVALLRELAPPRLVYVSCNPTSAARDLEPLVAEGYRIDAVRPLDLFPHTPHVETVLALSRGSTLPRSGAPRYAGHEP